MNGASHPRVVVIGAGFGGLAVAKALAKAPVNLTVVDRRNFHLFQPLLYQVATAALSPADISAPIRTILRKQENARVMLAKVTGIDRIGRKVLTEDGSIPFDYLVIATGARHSYFGRDEWSEIAPGIKTIDDATRLRAKLLVALERAEVETDPALRAALLTFAIVGGGPTGVELAGAISELARNSATRDFRSIKPADIRVILIEGGPRVLGSFHESLSQSAQRALEQMHVEVRTGAAVSAIHPDQIEIGETVIATRNVIWAAGVRASPAGRWLDAPTDRAGRVMVGSDFSLPDDANVFVIGDTAAYAVGDGKFLPGVAPAAKQAGTFVGKLIGARINGANPPRAFAYADVGMLATIGRNAAVADLGWIRVTGIVGWFFWSFVHVWFLAGHRNRFGVALSWAWSYLTWERGARLITGAEIAMADPPQTHSEAGKAAR
ncbi:Ndh NADH dehydrogenase, FAD-containing subunit [Rhabdaerophilaceae bacterium]